MLNMEQLLARARELAGSEEGGSVARGTKLLTLAEILRGREHGLAKTLQAAIDACAMTKINVVMLGRAVDGIARGLLSDLEAGLIPDLETRVRSEVEGDLLAQAHRLLEERLKDPAAMLIGAVSRMGSANSAVSTGCRKATASRP